jgi:hypothetical protein
MRMISELCTSEGQWEEGGWSSADSLGVLCCVFVGSPGLCAS